MPTRTPAASLGWDEEFLCFFLRDQIILFSAHRLPRVRSHFVALSKAQERDEIDLGVNVVKHPWALYSTSSFSKREIKCGF